MKPFFKNSPLEVAQKLRAVRCDINKQIRKVIADELGISFEEIPIFDGRNAATNDDCKNWIDRVQELDPFPDDHLKLAGKVAQKAFISPTIRHCAWCFVVVSFLHFFKVANLHFIAYIRFHSQANW